MADSIATILIVGDAPTDINGLAEALAGEYRLHVALNGPQALQLAEQSRPDLILLDLTMPGLDGDDLLRRLRGIESLGMVPAILVTALDGPEDASIGLRLGAADYISKPYHPELVRLRVRNHLQFARQRAELQERNDQLQRQNEGLRSALERHKRLEGIITICMGCKKIRDDQDGWHQLEKYLSKHSEAFFSHGFCPQCAQKQMEKGSAAGGRPAPPVAGMPGGQDIQTVQDCLERFRILCDSSPVGIFMADDAGRKIYSNPRLEEISGQSAAAILGHGWEMSIHPDDRAEARRFWGEVIAAGRAGSHEKRLQTPEGETSRVRTLVNPIRNQDGRVTGYVGTVEDITHLSQAQEEMIKIQKLESVGLLAGGIAHDFNNILTGILGNVSLAQMFVEESNRARGPLDEVERASEQAVALARQLLTFARGCDPVKKAVPVRHLVTESVTMALRGSNVQGVIDIPEGIRAVEVDEGQLLQALSNVVINAAQAMPEGGKLTVEAKDVRLGTPNRMGLPAGEYVRISVADEGCGIPDANLGKIFDPYFSTKSNCTGLGLASTHSIIAKHGGHVGARSHPGKGTAVTLHLPSCEMHFPAGGIVDKAAVADHHGGGKILVMDDELMIRTIAAQMLECLGYQVVVCENGSEAISLYRAARDAGTPFDAVIMDLTVAGGMGGEESARHILAIDPGARLVVSSGYYNDCVMADFKKYGFCAVMPKPYKTSELSGVLSNILRDCVR